MSTLSFALDDAFSWRTALSLAMASKLNHEESSSIEMSTTSEWGFSFYQTITGHNVIGFAAARDDVFLVSFRGTQSFGSWLLEEHKLEQRPYGSIHAGFLETYRSVENEIRTILSASPARKLWLTGHGLGGAVASIAAAELLEEASIAGIYSYGQPRLGDEASAGFFQGKFANRCFRIINDRDLLSRLPPAPFIPLGHLVCFDSAGNASFGDPGEIVSALEPEPYTPGKFGDLQSKARQLNGDIQKRGLSGSLLDTSLEGLFPSLADSRLDRYIALIKRYVLAPAIDPLLHVEDAVRSFAGETNQGFNTARPRKGLGETVSVLLRLKEPLWTPPSGLTIGSRIGNILRAQGSLEDLRKLKADTGIESVEVSRDAGGQELATSVPFVGGDAVHRPPLSEKGDAALVGFIDSGIDVLHEAFRDTLGKTRILAVWNQFDDTGPTPHAVDPAHFQQSFGTLYLASDIQDFINGVKATPPGLRDPKLHGTHVASIAAGRAVGAIADGMAPEARIVAVIPKMAAKPNDPVSVGYSSSHLEALVFLKRVSDGGSVVSIPPCPMAVNVSLGMNAGAHDGTSSLEAIFDSINNKGRDPGFVIAKSAGNERGWGGHARLQVFEGLKEIRWESSGNYRQQDYIELWYDGFDEVEFQLCDPAGNITPPITRLTRKVTQTLGGNICNLVLTINHRDNGDNQLLITIEPVTATIQAGTWKIIVLGKKVRSERRVIDVWVE
jgi:hypothetical protein